MEFDLSTIAVITASVSSVGLIVYYMTNGKKKGGEEKK
jgi:hypothetical protein